jgi:UDP-N-acetyl-D-mannosaminuronic acid dehydrogenase
LGGCGHVGLPLAITFAQKGLHVSIYDINVDAIRQVRAGRMPFLEGGAEPALRQVIGRSLVVDNDPELVSRARFVVVIGTPVDEHLNPTDHRTLKHHAPQIYPDTGRPCPRPGQTAPSRGVPHTTGSAGGG